MNILKKQFIFSLIVGLVGFSISRPFEDYLALFLILSLGLLHGSNDLMVIQKLASYEQVVSISYRKTLLVYISLILLVLFLFYTQRQFALLFFVIISSFHFGQQHWHRRTKGMNVLRYALYTSYGLLIFGLLFWTHAEQSSLVIEAITSLAFTAHHFIGLSAVAFVLVLVLFIIQSLSFRIILLELGVLLFILTVFRYTSLLLSFALYFSLWHAMPSIKDQIELLYPKSSSLSFTSYVKAAFLYWGISVVGFGLILFLVELSALDVLELLVYFLAAITFPHVIVMSRVERALES
ncbi:MAG: Brp/Blh family beta-carotene 15,15'-dioxygenase [Flavobacteriaceae bacterium]